MTWIVLEEAIRILARHLCKVDGRSANDLISKSVSILLKAGRQGLLRAEGIHYTYDVASPIQKEDWQKLFVYAGNRLDAYPRSIRARPVRITDVVIWKADLESLLRDQEIIGSDQTKGSRATGPGQLADEGLKKAFPDGVPPPAKLSNKKLVGMVEQALEPNKPPSSDTILRRAGRKKSPGQ